MHPVHGVGQLHWSGRIGKLCGDCRSQGFSVHNNGFKVLDAYSNMGLLLNSKIFEIEHI